MLLIPVVGMRHYWRCCVAQNATIGIAVLVEAVPASVLLELPPLFVLQSKSLSAVSTAVSNFVRRMMVIFRIHIYSLLIDLFFD